ncbi:MAG: TolC family outer membrane protein [Rhodospirillales bacterium]|jgi:outer membrane protein, adhesin transport system|nr:TolC family outer membrane protein [Rhodospirillales bacterium]
MLRSKGARLAWVYVGVCLIASAPAFANPLSGELRSLLQTHPDIQSAEKSMGSTREEVNKLRAEYLPTVVFNADMGHQTLDNPSLRASNTAPYTRARQTASLTVTQNLFNGFSTTSGVRIAQLNSEVAKLSLEGTRQNILLEGIRAYITVQRQKRLIDLSFSNEDNIQFQLNLEDERVQRGAGIAVDVLQAKSRLQIAKERRVSFEGALEDAISRYVKVFDHAPDLDAMADPPAPIELIPPELERAVEMALTFNPAISNSASSVAVARETKRRTTSEYYPSVDLVGKWSFDKNVDSTLGVKRDYQFLLQASWDLFTGLSTQASETQAAFDLGASMDRENLASRNVVEQTRISWQALLTARKRVELLENAVSIASEVFDARQKLREAGKETVINVLDSENEIFNARINFVQASYDEQLAIYQLLLAMGQLTSELMELG